MSDPSVYRQLADLEERLRRLESVDRTAFVGARAATAAGQLFINNTFAAIDFDTVTYDPQGAVATGAAWTYTCPVAGYYRVQVAVLFASTATWTGGEVAEVDLYRNGAQYSVLSRRDDWPSGATLYAGVAGADDVLCARGDTLQARAIQVSGANLALYTDAMYNYISIARLA